MGAHSRPRSIRIGGAGLRRRALGLAVPVVVLGLVAAAFTAALMVLTSAPGGAPRGEPGTPASTGGPMSPLPTVTFTDVASTRQTTTPSPAAPSTSTQPAVVLGTRLATTDPAPVVRDPAPAPTADEPGPKPTRGGSGGSRPTAPPGHDKPKP